MDMIIIVNFVGVRHPKDLQEGIAIKKEPIQN